MCRAVRVVCAPGEGWGSERAKLYHGIMQWCQRGARRQWAAAAHDTRRGAWGKLSKEDGRPEDPVKEQPGAGCVPVFEERPPRQGETSKSGGEGRGQNTLLAG